MVTAHRAARQGVRRPAAGGTEEEDLGDGTAALEEEPVVKPSGGISIGRRSGLTGGTARYGYCSPRAARQGVRRPAAGGTEEEDLGDGTAALEEPVVKPSGGDPAQPEEPLFMVTAHRAARQGVCRPAAGGTEEEDLGDGTAALDFNDKKK
ncbi:hypothetical protein quinque_004369 [Culex quinquefasciatus]